MNSDEAYQVALEAVDGASDAYHAGLANDAAITADTGRGVTPWAPVVAAPTPPPGAAMYQSGRDALLPYARRDRRSAPRTGSR